MPSYSFKCERKNGGCGNHFEIKCRLHEYDPAPKCPKCSVAYAVYREYQKDNINVSVPVTVGSFIDKNKKSKDEKRHLNIKHNEHKYYKEGEAPKLPDGMTRIKKKPWEDD